jgi:hypothetical protein
MARRLVFLFGAGASKGAGATLPYSPPVMPELFDELARHVPFEWGVKGWLHPYADGFRRDFEGTFAATVQRLPKPGWTPHHHVLEQLTVTWSIAEYFARFTINAGLTDYYSRLLTELEAHRLIKQTLFCTLNYDCLLEQAAALSGLQVDYGCTRKGASFLRVAKLHGSCNFVTHPVANHAFSSLWPGQVLDIGFAHLPVTDLPNALLKARANLGFNRAFPVLALMSPGKEHLITPTPMRAMRALWQSEVMQATELFIIGVGFNERDSHIIEPVRQLAIPIWYIGGHHERWRDVNAHCRFIGPRFEDAFTAIVERLVT